MEIILENITKVYEESGSDSVAVSDVSVRIEPGEFFFLLGPSGCGKTTILRIIAGLIEPTAGRILFNGTDVTRLPVEKRNSAMVFQSYALWPHMTVRENVEFGPRMRHMERTERRRFANDQLARVQMSDLERRKPNQLSGGQQQRVALARALAARADCLLLDEPLSNLDARLRLHMRDELRRLVKSSGITAIYVTHDQKEALSMADRIGVMNEGMIVQIGTPEQIYEAPDTKFVADFLGEANFINGRLIEKGPPAKIQTQAGTILASRSGKIGVGDEITCCIRPERIAVVADKGPEKIEGVTLLPAKIISTTYLGEIRQYICAVGGTGDLIWKISTLAGSIQGVMESDQINLRIGAADVALVGIEGSE